MDVHGQAVDCVKCDSLFLPSSTSAQRDRQIGFGRTFKGRYVRPQAIYSSSAFIAGKRLYHAAGEAHSRNQHTDQNRISHTYTDLHSSTILTQRAFARIATAKIALMVKQAARTAKHVPLNSPEKRHIVRRATLLAPASWRVACAGCTIL